MTEETPPIGSTVRCPECEGLSDALAREDGDLTCSFCRSEVCQPGAIFEGLTRAAERKRREDPDGRYVLVPDREPDDDEPPDEEHGYDDHFDEPYSPGFYS